MKSSASDVVQMFLLTVPFGSGRIARQGCVRLFLSSISIKVVLLDSLELDRRRTNEWNRYDVLSYRIGGLQMLPTPDS